jgi:hypothetical protein
VAHRGVESYDSEHRGWSRNGGIFMSKCQKRYERALAALKIIAQTMSNVVFRVEDYQPPSHRDQPNQRPDEKQKRAPTKRLSRNG